MNNSFCSIVLCSFLILGLSSCDEPATSNSPQESDKGLNHPTKACINEPPVIGDFEGVEVFEGGFSGIHYIPGTDHEFYIINDRGPNIPLPQNASPDGGEIKLFPFPEYSQKLVRVKMHEGNLEVLEVSELMDAEGNKFSGLPPVDGDDEFAETAWRNTEGDIVPPSPSGVDIEGLTFDSDTTFWFSEEYRPSLWQVNLLTGKTLQVLKPAENLQSTNYLPAVFSRRSPNRGFESIAKTKDGRIHAMLQSPLWNPDAETGVHTRISRMITYDPVNNTSTTRIYEMNPARGNVSGDHWKVGDMTAVDEHRFIVIEHGSNNGDFFADLYLIDIRGISPIEEYQEKQSSLPALETYMDTETLHQERQIRAVKKTHLLDLLEAGYPAEHGKPEGISLIDANTIAVLNDNDYAIDWNEAQGAIVEVPVQTCIQIFEITVPELN